MTNILFIGDPHFQITNIPEVDLFIEKITVYAQEHKPQLICIAGDVLHTHEKIHTTVLNKAYTLVNNLRIHSPVYILVGNHDYINNRQYLTDSHWMCGMKDWEGVTVVDKVIKLVLDDYTFVFVPYVPPGRFIEALDTIEGWQNAECIFAHQEFCGCKMGPITSIEGDKWPLNYPHVVSGHIHSKQQPQDNIYYPGSSLQVAFGESENNIVAMLTFTDTAYPYDLNEVDLGLPKKKIVYMKLDDIDTYKPPTDNPECVKITLKGDFNEFKTLKKSKKYKSLVDSGIKVVFKANPVKNPTVKINTEKSTGTFSDILHTIVINKKDKYLNQMYESIVNNKEVDLDDILFL